MAKRHGIRTAARMAVHSKIRDQRTQRGGRPNATGSPINFLHVQNFQHLTGLDYSIAIVVDQILGEVNDSYNGGIEEICKALTQDGGEITSLPSGFTIFVHFSDNFSKVGFRCDTVYVECAPELRAISTPITLAIVIQGATQREAVTFPLPVVLRTFEDVCGRFQVYRHSYLRDEDGKDIVGAKYTGVTKRGWRARWKEHLRAAESGSRYRFHGAIRHWDKRASLISREIVGVGLSEADAMRIEEADVAHDSLFPAGLNMIPGGYAGIRYLHELGALGRSETVSVDERSRVIERFFETSSRRGLPNPLAAARWCNPMYAEKIICGPDNRLKPDQIRNARALSSMGKTADEIVLGVGARNVLQISRLLSGSTYGRIV